MSHTPGPWKAVYDRTTNDLNMFEIAEVSHLRIILESGGWPTRQGSPEDDARLIAAAPDLLVALRDCVLEFEAVLRSIDDDAVHFDGDEFHERLTLARAAIAKATGEKA